MGKTCKDCPDRHLHCHSTCEIYQENREKWDEIREAKRKRVDEEDFHRSVHFNNKSKGRW